jgi:hypothetical protein
MNKKTFKHKITGDIVSEKFNLDSRFYTNNVHSISALFVENSNDWEEIKEFPKIISFRKIKGDSMGAIAKLRSNGFYSIHECPINDVDINKFLYGPISVQDGCFEIYQVQTETDIWTIGDKFTFNGLGGSNWENKHDIIKGFDFKLNGNLAVKYSNGAVCIDKIQKAKNPILVTEDNVEIFEGDYPWLINILNNYHIYQWGDGKKGFYITEGYINLNPENLKIFSTKEAAKEYIELNKPQFSKRDVLDFATYHFYHSNLYTLHFNFNTWKNKKNV